MDQEEPEIQTSGMLCPHCPGRNPASVSFCTHCGQPTRPANGGCSNCLAELPKDAQFCPECGAPAGIPIGRFPPAEPEYMGFWIRAAAGLTDVVIITLVSKMIKAIAISSLPLPTDLPMDLIAELIAPIVYLAYYVVLTGLKGQTLGKMALGIMVVYERDKPPGILRAAFREILGKFVSYTVLCLGYLWIGWDKNKQGWHDHIASTYVIRAPGRRGRPAKSR